MHRGTTPTLRFTIIDKKGQVIPAFFIEKIYVSIAQNKIVLIERTDVTFENNLAVVNLTQEETLMLSSGLEEYPAEIQIRGILVGGKKFASKKVRFEVEEILKDGEI